MDKGLTLSSALFQAMPAYMNGVYNPGQYPPNVLHPSNPFYCSEPIPSRQPQYHSQDRTPAGSPQPPYPVPHCQGVSQVFALLQLCALCSVSVPIFPLHSFVRLRDSRPARTRPTETAVPLMPPTLPSSLYPPALSRNPGLIQQDTDPKGTTPTTHALHTLRPGTGPLLPRTITLSTR